MWINKVDQIEFKNIGLTREDLIYIGFNMEELIKAEDTINPQKLRVIGSNAHIKDKLNDQIGKLNKGIS